MKTQILLISFLCTFAWSVQAQKQQRNDIFHTGSEQFSARVNPPQPGFKPNHMVVPAKRNMFDSSGYVWKWDTIFCYKTSGSAPYYRVTRKYNSSGDSLVQLMELSEGSFAYVNYARESFTFDSAGNWLTYLSEKWENNAWGNQSKKKFVYNSNGDMVDWKTAGWQSNAWANGWHYYYHYDTNGLYDTALFQMGQDSLWVNHELGIPSYDSNGYMTSGLTYSWINNGWAVTSLGTYTYTSNGDYLSSLRQIWQNSTWVNDYFSNRTYDSAGNQILIIIQYWQNNAWANSESWSYTYDANGNNTIWLRQVWLNGSWVNSSRQLYPYDTSNNMLSYTTQSWDNSSWKNGDTEQYTYDAYGNSVTGKYMHWYGGWQPYNGSLMVYADHQRDDYVNLIEVYRYAAVIDSILVFTERGLSKGQVTLYPNPAHLMIYVSSPATSAGSHGSLTLYDLRGQILLTKQMENETTGIDISSLKPGVYFVRFSNSRMTRVLKFVKD